MARALRLAGGKHEANLTWQAHDEFSYGVEGTTTTLRVEIARRGRAMLHPGSGSYAPVGDADTMGMMLVEDPSVVFVPILLKVETEDGVIDVEAETGLVVSEQGEVTVSASQDLNHHRGSFRVQEVRDDRLQICNFRIELGFTTKGTLVGSIGGSYIISYGEIMPEYACFPEMQPPELRYSSRLPGCGR